MRETLSRHLARIATNAGLPLHRWISGTVIVCLMVLVTLYSFLLADVRTQADQNTRLVVKTHALEERNRQALTILCEQTTIMASVARDTAAAIRLAVPSPERLRIARQLDEDAVALESESACNLVGVP